MNSGNFLSKTDFNRASAKQALLLRWGVMAALMCAVVLSSCGLRKSVETLAGLEISKPYQPSKTTAAQHDSCSEWQAESFTASVFATLEVVPESFPVLLTATTPPTRSTHASAPLISFAERREFSSKIQLYILYKQLKRAL